MKPFSEERPRIRISLTPFDWIIEILAWAGILFLCAYAILEYNSLPQQIPTHFDFSGTPDSYGGKVTIYLLPVLGTIMFIILSVLKRVPHAYNFPVKITPDNAARMYTVATRLIRILRFALTAVFSAILYSTVQTAKGNAAGLDPWFLPLFLALVFIPIIWAIIAMFKQ